MAIDPSSPSTSAEAAGRAAPAPALAPAHATDGYRFWVVPHTHWDREWYLPFEPFRMRLVRTVDEILDVLETDPSFRRFVLDGQAVILEDYLEIEPHQAPRLRRLVEAGRIAIGPAYILPDEYLVGAESIVRDLLMGRQVCERLGGAPMAVGYMPDTFGHVEQLPQILRGFGLDTFVFWRGLGDEADELGAVFRWRGPDGSEVTAIRQLGSYGNSDELGRWGRNGTSFKAEPARWPEVAALRMDRFLELFGDAVRRSGFRDVLLCNGSDHKPIQRDLPALLEAVRLAHPGAAFEIATYEEYVAALRAAIDASGGPERLALREGELCGGKDAAVLRGVNSARLELKQANEATERALFVAEALAVLAELRASAGRPTAHTEPGAASAAVPYRYPLDALRHAWRELLRNQPHDSISGCSVDEVHADMAQRYVSAQQIAARVRDEALAALAGRTAGWAYRETATIAQALVNVLPFERAAAVELPLPESLRRASRLVAEVGGELVPLQLMGSGADRRGLIAARVPGFGSRPVRLRRPDAADATPVGARAADPATIENERYRVRALPNGSLEVTDRRAGLTHRALLRFEDVADRGDEYNFCPLAGDVAWTSEHAAARVAITADGPAVAELRIEITARLPRALRRDRSARARATVACPIRTVVRLIAGVERIELTTTILNRALDHRLRVVFEAPESNTQVRAEGHYGLVRRPALPVWSGEGWQEPPALTHHTSGAVAAGSLTLHTKGLPEYQAVLRPGGGVDVALTLLRCVGWLSRDDLSTRTGHAGPAIETPAAQCQGERTFEYAIDFDGLGTDAAILRASQDFRTPLVAGPAGVETDGLLQLDGDRFVLAALKGAEDRDGSILRLYAGADEPATARPRGVFAAVEQCRLDEAPYPEASNRMAPEPRGQAELEIRPSEVVTLRLRGAR